MAVDLVEKLGRLEDSAYLLWFLHEFGEESSQTDIKKYFNQKWNAAVAKSSTYGKVNEGTGVRMLAKDSGVIWNG